MHETVSPFLDQVTFSAVTVFIIQRLKASQAIPWVNEGSQRVNQVLMAFGSALASAGMHFTLACEGGSFWAGGKCTSTLEGLSLVAVLHLVWHYVGSLSVTEGLYRILKASKNGA